MSALDTANSRRAPRGQWLLASAALLLAFACLVLPSRASAQATPQGCGYGTGGPNASNLCWFDMTAYNDTLARTPAGQPMSVTLPGGYTVTFALTSRPVPGSPNHPIVDPRAVPIETRFAFGFSDYVGVAGRPALYSRDAGTNGVSLTLSNISVVDSSGAPVTGYSFVIADAENNINTENFTWTSDKPLELVGVANPTSTRGCHNALTGLGTTSVTCTGQGTDPGGSPPRPWYDAVVVGADTPSMISVSMRTPARSGVAFAIMTSKIQVTKNVVGRVRGSDSFDVSATSPEGSIIGSASTGSGSSATTGSLTVLPRTNGSSYTLAEAATSGSGTRLADYSQSWSCTNAATSSTTPLPSGSGTSVTVSPAPGDDISCTVTNTQLPADLAVVKTASPSPAVPGTNETYTLRVTNNGPSRATNARVSDQLPSGLSFVSASSACGEAGGTVTCTVGTLDPGASQTFTVTAKIASSAKSCSQLTNTATAASDTPDSDPGNNASSLCVPIRGASGLSISKTPSVAELPIGGGQVMYTLVVANAGPSDATGVKVSDQMAAGLTVVAADPSQGSCSTTGSKVLCDVGSLVAGGSAQVLVTAQTWATPGAITNTATVSGDQEDPNRADNTASATVSVPALPSPPAPPPAPPSPPAPIFDLAVSKTANHRIISVGQRVTYTIVVVNKGPAAAPGVRMTDTLNAPASVVSVKTTAGSCAKAIPMTCSVGTIPAGGKVTITVVTEPKQSGCRQRNAASATGEGTDASPASNLDTVDLCARKVALRLSKVADRSKANAGGLMRYTIRVTNPTKARVRNVKTCDRLPSALVYVSSRSKARLTGGSYCWTARALAAGASLRYRITVRILRGASGTRINRASVNGLQAHTRTANAAIRVLPARAQAGGVTG